MAFFFFPDEIKVVFSVDPDLLALLQRIADQSDDRAAAANLSKDVKASTAALAGALPKP